MVKTKFSIWFFTFMLVATAGSLLWLGICVYQAERATAEIKERYHRIEVVGGELAYLSEKLIGLSRTAVVMGSPAAAGQYQLIEAKMRTAVKRATDTFPSTFRRENGHTNIGRDQLFDLEHQALALLADGNGAAGRTLLFGDEMDNRKIEYGRTLDRLNLFLKQQMQESLAVEDARAGLAGASFITVLIVLLLCWLMLLFIARRFRDELVEANQSLSKRTEELNELNRTLDQKVKERTQGLTEALIELQKTHMDLKTAQAQLLQSEKFSATGQLAAGVAHEINNPIGFISSNLQTLQKYLVHYTKLLGILNKLEKALRDKDQAYAAELVDSWQKTREETNFVFIGNDIGNLIRESLEGSEKIRKIVLDLRAFTSPDKGMVAAVDLRALMESMLNIVWNELKYKVQLHKEYGDIPLMTCNPQKIGQVFVNLLMNAAYAIKEKGTITIKMFAEGDLIHIEMTDTGCGIPAENLTKIFDPFFTTKPPGQGVGLGLSLSYDIVKKHGGTMTFESKAGQGTTFKVILPSVLAIDPAQVKEAV